MRKESDEEKQFEAWLDEATGYGLVHSYEKQPGSFHLTPRQSVIRKKQLKTKVKNVERFVCGPHIYTADFRVILTDVGYVRLLGIFQKSSILGFPRSEVFVDTKGSFMKRGDTGEFTINQKLVYELHDVWVAKVVPREFFGKTWLPESLRWMKKRKKPTLTKLGGTCKTVKEFLDEAQPHQQ